MSYIAYRCMSTHGRRGMRSLPLSFPSLQAHSFTSAHVSASPPQLLDDKHTVLASIHASELKQSHNINRSKCSGCGSHFQVDNESKPGYLTERLVLQYQKKTRQLQNKLQIGAVDPDKRKWNNDVVAQLVCSRCHDLAKHNHTTIAGPNITPKELDLTKTRKAVFIQMVDILDYPATHFPIHPCIPDGASYFIVFNKIDLLPLDVSRARLKQWSEHFVSRLGLKYDKAPVDVFAISSKSGEGIKEMMAKIQKHRTIHQLRDVYLLGHTNVGKSEFLNCLHRMVRFPKSAGKLISSRVNGSTIAQIPIPLARFNSILYEQTGARDLHTLSPLSSDLHGHLIDTPGLYTENRLSTLVQQVAHQKMIHIGKRLQPQTFNMLPRRSIFLGGLCRLDYVAGSSESRLGFTVWSSELLRNHITSMQKAHTGCSTEDVKYVYGSADFDPKASKENQEQTGQDESVEEADDELGDVNDMVENFLQECLYEADALSEHTGKKSLPDILVPPSVEEREQLPPWKLAGQWTIRGDGISRAWSDVVFGGIGWISIRGQFEWACVRAYTPGGVGAYLRDPLLPFDFARDPQKI